MKGGWFSFLKAEPYSVKEAVLFCLFVLGIRVALEFILVYIFRAPDLFFGICFSALVFVIARNQGKKFLPSVFVFRPVTLPVFFSLLVMYLGFEIIATELLNLFTILLPIPDGLFGSRTSGNVLMVMLSGAALPALSEELLFRGIILNRLCVKCSERKAIIVSSLLFGLMHLNPWQFVNATIGGFFYGWIYRRYKNLWLTIFLHCYYNILVTFMIIPYTVVPNTRTYAVLVVHPLWFDIMGIVLFTLGLILTWGISRTDNAPERR